MMNRRDLLKGTLATGIVASSIPFRLPARAASDSVIRHDVGYFTDTFSVTDRIIKSAEWQWHLSVIGKRMMIRRIFAGYWGYGLGGDTVSLQKLGYLEWYLNASSWQQLIKWKMMPAPAFQSPSVPVGTPLDWDVAYSPNHIETALERVRQIQMIYNAFLKRAPTYPELALHMWHVARVAKSTVLAGRQSSDGVAYAQEALEPVTITMPAIGEVYWSGGIDPAVGGYTTIQAAERAKARYECANGIRLASLCQQAGYATPPPPALPPVFTLSPETQAEFLARLDRESVPAVEALAMWKAFGASLLLITGGGTISRAGGNYIAQGWAAGTIGTSIAMMSTGGFVIAVVGVPMIVLGFYIIYTIYNAQLGRVEVSGVMLPRVGTLEAGMAP
jgi:hypothetical protein